ncbi:hypothetical protein [Hymenobacter wooponensis]|uniref:Uncharacterized protein n=1 Tax=Hymenobacter wooponensis TaxID=1525360 RepID=A0A4Z0MUP3_9BACT|nr:hypothetical protein [Hymenobacter wooponensis]TGD82845.1 hypothetical protein EU557_03435 [Hymenobacter wooponensis]
MSTEIEKPNTKVAKAKTTVSSLTLGNADDALTLATELQKFVRDNKLTSTIQGKQFPNVEAWQFAGTLLGLSAVLESIEDKSSEAESKWAATVQLVNVKTGDIVGRGFATCSNKEHTKRSFADYAICSMAQTRAVGKAYRLTLGWLMKAAGYEATPAEEMADQETSAQVVDEKPRPTQPAAQEASAPASPQMVASEESDPNRAAEDFLSVALIIDLINSAETLDELQGIWFGEAKPYQKEIDVLGAKEARKTLLKNASAQAA